MAEQQPFHQRFDIDLNMEQAQVRFVNRAYQAIFRLYMPAANAWQTAIVAVIGAELGTSPQPTRNIRDFIQGDFFNCLRAIEAFYEHQRRGSSAQMGASAGDINNQVKKIISNAEGDIGVEWRGGQFWRSGAKILDEKLVNDNLRWLRDKGFSNIYEPFDKALTHYTESISNPEKLQDVVTDMYEALEATAKVVTGRENIDLSGNYQLFIKALVLSEHHKEMMKAYINYANEFRHGKGSRSKQMNLSNSEAENFIYMTGIFIRFAIQKLEEQV